MNEKISVIVPIYNSEKYLRRCINSILCQTYSNLEIILINDGSTDNSKAICEEYVHKDSRIKFISKKNTGVSDTRNIGIEKSTGKYIGFVDSDDVIKKNMFEILYTNITKYNADLSACEINIKNKKYDNSKKVISNNRFLKFMLEENGPQGYLWNKLYKKSIIEENKILLDTSIHICEDLLFNCKYLEKSSKVIYEKTDLYIYIDRKDSASNKEFDYKWVTILDAYEKMKEIYKNKENDIFDLFKAYYILTNINTKTKMYLANIKDKNIINRCNSNISLYLEDVLKSKNICIKLKIKVFFYYNFYNIINIIKKLFKKV